MSKKVTKEDSSLKTNKNLVKASEAGSQPRSDGHASKDSKNSSSKSKTKEFANSSKVSSIAKRPRSAATASQNWKSLIVPSTKVSPATTKILNINKKKTSAISTKPSSLTKTGTAKTEISKSSFKNQKEKKTSALSKIGNSEGRYVQFSSIPKGELNKFGMIAYDDRGIIKTRLPLNLAPHVKSNTPAVALDCEFVDIGGYEREFALGRIAVVNEYGYLLYHAFSKPKVEVMDYVTEHSGLRPQDLENGVELEEVQKMVCKIIEGRILVGHSLHSDMSVLKLNHPRYKTRDTAVFFRKVYRRLPSLKVLTQDILGVSIQHGEHEPTEDAQAAMKIYLQYRLKWEKYHKDKVYQLPKGELVMHTDSAKT